MKAKGPTLIEYLHSTAKLSVSPIDFGEFLQDFNYKTGFAERWSLMTFVIDATTLSYPFVNNVATEVTGHPVAALREGGIEFISSKFKIPDRFLRELMSRQIGFLVATKDIDLTHIRVTQSYPLVDKDNRMRFVTQQHAITHRSSEGLPLGFHGIGWHLKHILTEMKISQQIETYDPSTGVWNVKDYLEFYPEVDDDKLLSRRELEILRSVSDGLSSIQIADKLCISVHTVNTHRKNMLRRTNSANTADILRYGVLHGLL